MSTERRAARGGRWHPHCGGVDVEDVVDPGGELVAAPLDDHRPHAGSLSPSRVPSLLRTAKRANSSSAYHPAEELFAYTGEHAEGVRATTSACSPV
jgi:hypothetical protein